MKHFNTGIKGQNEHIPFFWWGYLLFILFIIYVPSSKVQVNRKRGGVAILALHLYDSGWNSVTVETH